MKENSRGRPTHPDVLTPGEWRVADAIRHGRANAAIARELGVSTDAVKFHVANILSKLAMRSRAELRQWDGVDAASSLARREAMDEDDGNRWHLRQIARSTADIAEARQFYGETLGMPELFSVGNMAFYDLGGTRLMVAEDGAATAESILYIATSDIHGRQRQLEARGVQFSHGAHLVHRHEDGSEEWMAFFNDNDGRPLALASLVPPSGR